MCQIFGEEINKIISSMKEEMSMLLYDQQREFTDQKNLLSSNRIDTQHMLSSNQDLVMIEEVEKSLASSGYTSLDNYSESFKGIEEKQAISSKNINKI